MKSKTFKDNYRPVSNLSIISKIVDVFCSIIELV